METILFLGLISLIAGTIIMEPEPKVEAMHPIVEKSIAPDSNHAYFVSGSLTPTKKTVGRDMNAFYKCEKNTFTIFFDINKSDAEETQILEEFATRASACEANKILVSGYASEIGTDAKNKELAHSRAKTMVKLLKSKTEIESVIDEKVIKGNMEYIIKSQSATAEFLK